MDNATVTKYIKMMNTNFMINNIELHKLLYADPYQYADELKRIKNFNSPRQAIVHGSTGWNSTANRVYNEGFNKGDAGYINFNKDSFDTVTLEDVMTIHDLPGYDEKPYEEGDGGGMIIQSAHKNFKLRSGDWNQDQEAQYKYDMAWEALEKSGASVEELAKFDKKNPEIKSTYTPSKPIVAGSKLNDAGRNYAMLDKYSLYPLSYRILYKLANKDENGRAIPTNAMRLYNKMQKENIDYAIFATGRKVGAEAQHSVYDKETGAFNDTPFEGKVTIPFSIMSIQSEVPSKDAAFLTRGSQITKLATLDFMNAGVPIDFLKDDEKLTYNDKYAKWIGLTEEQKKEESPLYKEISNNNDLLKALTQEGFNNLLEDMGITFTTNSKGEKTFRITNFEKSATLLREEVLKRETNDNIEDSLAGFLKGEVVIEATPAYRQIRDILYSVADSRVIRPKMPGGLKVQISSSFLEDNKMAPITTESGKKAFKSDVLGFYIDDDGKRVCELMLGRWFKSDMTDEALLEYLNNTEEGQKMLSGIAFRTPTQKQNSIDVFKIAKFLPKEFGDSVVIPSGLVKKAGSDFDIDKLSIYLKNIFKDSTGKLSLVEYKGSREATVEFYEKEFDKKLEKNKGEKELALLNAIKDVDTIDTIINTEDESVEQRLMAKNKKLDALIESFGDDFDDAANFLMEKAEKLRKGIAKLNNADVQKEFKEFFVKEKYRQSLENAYIQSLQNLISHPMNFNSLVKPNSADQLKTLSEKITEKLGVESLESTVTSNMLHRGFMSRLRHAFVTGKYAVGIAAVNQTNHSLNQRQPINIDRDRIKLLSEKDQKWIGNAIINFRDKNGNPAYNMINGEATLSMVENADGQAISDIIAQFIDGYVDISKGAWIMELGATPNVAGTFLFLAKVGVPVDTIGYFMNQPIIRDYLKSIETSGYSYLFIDKLVDYAKSGYKTTKEDVAKINTLPKEASLWKSIGQKEFTPLQAAEQHFILDEFLKYAMMADQMFKVTQGTNFDTSSFNDGTLVFKKEQQLQQALNTIFSGVDKLLENSHVGDLAVKIHDIRDAYAEVLVSDQKPMRQVVQKILSDYINIPDRDFVKLAQKVVTNVFDWAVQTNENNVKGLPLNTFIKDYLVNKNTNVAKKVNTFVKNILKDKTHPLYDNQVIKLITPDFSQKEGGVNNIKIKNKDNKVYDQNQIISAFEEIKEFVKDTKDANLYDQLVALSVLQSGLENSSISFTSLLPYEDFKRVYNSTIADIENKVNLTDFLTLKVFERNNWNNSDVVSSLKAKYLDPDEKTGYNPNMNYLDKKIKSAILDGKIPQVMTLNPRYNREANEDIIVYTWNKDRGSILTAEDRANKITVDQKIKEMRRIGDYSYMNKGLFQKVYESEGVPLISTYVNKQGQIVEQFVYKMINAWGDGSKANEFYNVGKASKINNGFVKVEETFDDKKKKLTSGEVDDSTIVPFFKSIDKKAEKVVPLAEAEIIMPTIDSSKKINIYAGTGENAELSNFANRPVSNALGVDFKNVEAAFQYAKINWSTGDNSDIAMKLQTASGAEAKALGKKITGLNTKAWDENSSTIMKSIIKDSFIENPSALKTLLATGNAELTHTQDNTKWGKEFPKLLMEVRNELRPTQAVSGDVKSQVETLEAKKKSKGLSPSEMATLAKLQTELGKQIKSNC
jgi:predicted NAD-dependent protein-ADP-ribosyltransferase YbiA (DUF1768 family)/predicted nucleic acid-binding protein